MERDFLIYLAVIAVVSLLCVGIFSQCVQRRYELQIIAECMDKHPGAVTDCKGIVK